MAKLVVQYTISPSQTVRLGYRQAFTNFPFTYITPFLTWDQSPYTIENLSEGSWEIELTAASSGCTITPCGTPIRIVAATGDPNTIHSELVVGLDSNKNVYLSITFSETITSSVTVTGTYTIAGQSKTYSVIIPSNLSAYSTIIDVTTFSSIDSYCYTSISPQTLNNKNISIDNISPC